jgi:hypothetical protein
MNDQLNTREFEGILKSLTFRSDLARIGGYRDGGYVLPFSDVLKSSILISGGVGSNARFEADCLDINPSLRVILIDKSFSKLRVLIRLFYHFIQKRNKGLVSLMEAASTFRVVRNSVLIKRFLDESYTLDSFLEDFNGSNVLLKLDIEGGEYSQLPSILKYENIISGLCIEFHDLNKSDNLILLNEFIENTKLKLVFISINESSIVDNKPTILELSFTHSPNNFTMSSDYLQASASPGQLVCKYFNLSNLNINK